MARAFGPVASPPPPPRRGTLRRPAGQKQRSRRGEMRLQALLLLLAFAPCCGGIGWPKSPHPVRWLVDRMCGGFGGRLKDQRGGGAPPGALPRQHGTSLEWLRGQGGEAWQVHPDYASIVASQRSSKNPSRQASQKSWGGERGMPKEPPRASWAPRFKPGPADAEAPLADTEGARGARGFADRTFFGPADTEEDGREVVQEPYEEPQKNERSFTAPRDWRRARGRGTEMSADNPRVSQKHAAEPANGGPPDGDGHISPNVQAIDRFRITKMIDKGTFGTVFKAWDTKWKESVAIKVVRKVKRYVSDGEFEVGILDELAELDREGRYCVKLYKYFHYQGHFCIVTELLGKSLYHSLKQLRQAGQSVSMSAIRRIAYQLCKALQFLRSVRLVHADLKTENILLARPDMSLDDKDLTVRLIDFGGATWEEDTHSRLIQTRHYRAPEVVLGLEWSFPCDMWSVGCILLELYESRLTFDTHDTAQHLAMINRLSGDFPGELIAKIPRDHSVSRMFDSSHRLRWPDISTGRSQEEAVYKVNPVANRIQSQHGDFRDLVESMLEIDPLRRVRPDEALRSEFLRDAA